MTFVLVALAVARTAGPLRFEALGFVGASRKRVFWMAFVFCGAYTVLVVVYGAAVSLKADSTPERLGADSGTLGMLTMVLIAGLLAPVLEETVFRGVVFRSLANGIGVFAGALASGVFFGMLHWDLATMDRLLQSIPLALFGVMLALLYAITGTLLAPIAMHATNNAAAIVLYASGEGSAAGVAGGALAWLLVIVAVAKLLKSRPTLESTLDRNSCDGSSHSGVSLAK